MFHDDDELWAILNRMRFGLRRDATIEYMRSLQLAMTIILTKTDSEAESEELMQETCVHLRALVKAKMQTDPDCHLAMRAIRASVIEYLAKDYTARRQAYMKNLEAGRYHKRD